MASAQNSSSEDADMLIVIPSVGLRATPSTACSAAPAATAEELDEMARHPQVIIRLTRSAMASVLMRSASVHRSAASYSLGVARIGHIRTAPIVRRIPQVSDEWVQ